MAFWKKDKQEVKQVEDKSFEGFRSINTEGKDLSQPFVDDYFNRRFTHVQFGEDNLYPQILNQLYISAPMHQACCNFKKYTLVGNGYEWEGYDDLKLKDQIDLKAWEKASNFNESFSAGALDWIKHGRVIALLHYNSNTKKYDKFILVDPENVRNNLPHIFDQKPTEYFYSRDWTRSHSQYKFTRYKQGNTDEWQVFELRNKVGGFMSYGMPDWISSANWQNVGADLGLLHKSAIENGIQPSVIYKYPYIMSPTERTEWADGMRQNAKGAKNYGRAMKVESQSKDMTPDIEVVKTTDNHKLFQQTSLEYKEETAISHNINPALMGVRIAGALGQSEEIEFSAKQFERIWLKENYDKYSEFLNKIVMICGLPAKLKIEKTKVIEIAQENNPEAKKQEEELKKAETEVNESLKGLSAKENMDMVRIVRDHDKGRMNEAMAMARLMAYGLSKELATNMLNTEE